MTLDKATMLLNLKDHQKMEDGREPIYASILYQLNSNNKRFRLLDMEQLMQENV